MGNHPGIKVLLLHGGPGATHEYFEAFESYFPAAGIEYYYYDQLGSAYSDQPDEPALWDLPRFVDEVEQVRQALRLDRDNFYVLGQSWGGILATEYALTYQQHLKGLIISNMVASIPAYNRYAHQVLMPAMDQKALAEIQQLEAAGKFADPRYEQLLMQHFYVEHVLRMPLDQWPDPVNWDRTADLPKITVPTLSIGARYDTMEPAQMEMIARKVQKGRYLFCPTGSQLTIYDDQKVYMAGIIQFLRDVDSGSF